jgi:hypothetical protein
LFVLEKKEGKNGAISPVKALNGAYSFGPLKSQLLSYLHFLISIFELSAEKLNLIVESVIERSKFKTNINLMNSYSKF